MLDVDGNTTMTTDLLWRQLLEAAVEIQHIIDNNECMQLLTKYPDLLIGASRWIQAQATEMNKCLDMQEVLRGEVDDLSKRIVNYSHKAYEANFQLERCYCEDKGYDPDYGWPVGDHVPVTMADSILARLVNMRAALEMLQRWDMLELNEAGYGVATADAAWARYIIKEALETT